MADYMLDYETIHSRNQLANFFPRLFQAAQVAQHLLGQHQLPAVQLQINFAHNLIEMGQPGGHHFGFGRKRKLVQLQVWTMAF